jgi:hypothetical protein
VFARFTTILSPVVAELHGIWPMIIYTSLAGFGAVCSIFLLDPKKVELTKPKE